VYEADVVNSSV